VSVHWAEIAGISVPAVVALASALYAGREARRARQSELEAERLRRAEERSAERKYETYKPMIESLGRMFDGVDPDVQVWKDFWTWISVYGSADAVDAFGRVMQCAFEAPKTPIHVLFRLATDFLLAVRREIGDTGTDLTPLALMGPKITDLYDLQSIYLCMTLPLEDLCRRCNWRPPWENGLADMVDDTADLRSWEQQQIEGTGDGPAEGAPDESSQADSGPAVVTRPRRPSQQSRQQRNKRRPR
jgi:hypothetical protein